MSNPTWLPAWPSWAPDFETVYRYMAPKQWPKNLFDEEGEAHTDQEAHGIIMSWARKGSWWILERLWPWLDSGELFLDRWEDAFGLEASQDLTARQNRIVASMRNRGTLTEAVVKAVFEWVFNTDDPNNITLAASTPDQTWGANIQWQTEMTSDLSVDFNAVSGHHQDNIFAVGDSGEIWESTGGAWASQASGTANDLHGVWVYDTTFAVAVGASSTIRTWNGAVWGAGPAGLPGGLTLYGAYGLSSTDYWVCGTGRNISHYDGSSWTNYTVGSAGDNWLDIHVTQDGYIWACASTGRIARSTDGGSSWTTWQPVFTSLNGIRGMRGGYEGHAWVVGASGVIRHWDTSAWQNEDQGTVTFRSLDGWQYNRLVAVGNDAATEAVCYRRKDSTWVSVATNSWGTLNGVWADHRSVYCALVGEDGWGLLSPPNDEGFMRSQNHLHIYSTNLDLDPDRGLADDKIALLQSVAQTWTVGRRLLLRASDTQSGAGNACAS